MVSDQEDRAVFRGPPQKGSQCEVRQSWVQIFREEPRGAAFGGGGEDERIPEAYPRFVFDTECHRKLGRGGFRAPDRVPA